ncbi:MAG TPA: flagellar hook-associated protein FlgK [Syntrophales bacterium]|nr:flagellar hook-associated protein FlgK [Syntrophales bacterium]HOL60031.1 flagellar hook-associated protein FlgK [Syntrophales bacterium]
MSIASLLYVARDALGVSQIGIDVVGANIANVNTSGYSRQRPVISSTGGDYVRGMVVQTSVAVDKIERLYDRYLEGQVVLQRQNIGYSSTLNDRLSSIESILNEAQSGGLNDQLNKFWAAWETLSANPSGQVERDTVAAMAESVATKLNSFSGDLVRLKTDIKTSIRDVVNKINSLAVEIRNLNEKVAETGAKGGETNILSDKLMGLLGDMAESVGIMWNEADDGTVSVFLENGIPLVERLVAYQLKAEDVGDRMVVSSAQVNPDEELNGFITKGKLGALIESQDEVIPDYQQLLNNFARSLAEAVNDLHHQGYDSRGNLGGDFFVYSDNAPAATIRLNPEIAQDLRLIAAGSTVNGDGENAASIAALKDELIMENGSSTLNAYFAAIIGRIGRQVEDSSTDLEHQNAILTNVTNRRESVAGVSIDEEMIELMKFQMSYQAAGRLVNVTDKLLDILMNLGVSS